VAEEGLRRWLDGKNDPVAFQKYQSELKRKKQFVDLIKETRSRLDSIYDHANFHKTGKRTNESESIQRAQKKFVFEQLQEDYAKLKQEWSGFTGYDDWFAESINNAQLNTVSAYYDLVPTFHQLIRNNGGDLAKFFTHVKGFERMSKEKRHRSLAEIKLTEPDQFFAAPDFPTQAASLSK
jgi:predicted aminopeptidase